MSLYDGVIEAKLTNLLNACVFHIELHFQSAYLSFHNQWKLIENTSQYGKHMHKQ